MKKRLIEAKQFVTDLRAGLDDEALMDKYALPARGLQEVFRSLLSAGLVAQEELDERMPSHIGTVAITRDWDSSSPGGEAEKPAEEDSSKPVIRAKEALKDVRSNMTDRQIMKKYRLSARGYQSLLTKLLKAGLIDRDELEVRSPMLEGTISLRGVADRDETPLTCPSCNSPLERRSDGCSRCGFSIRRLKIDPTVHLMGVKSAWICGECGLPVPRRLNKCPACGGRTAAPQEDERSDPGS